MPFVFSFHHSPRIILWCLSNTQRKQQRKNVLMNWKAKFLAVSNLLFITFKQSQIQLIIQHKNSWKFSKKKRSLLRQLCGLGQHGIVIQKNTFQIKEVVNLFGGRPKCHIDRDRQLTSKMLTIRFNFHFKKDGSNVTDFVTEHNEKTTTYYLV